MDAEDTRITEKNYKAAFDSRAYANGYYSKVAQHQKETLKLLHELYSSYGPPPAGLKVLDYGCGPVVAYEISAALQASEIVMAEYVEQNRKQVQLWVNKDPEAMDWRPFFKYVVTTLEGKSEQEALAREEELRKRIKAIVPCDITADPPIQAGYEGPYDIVFSSLAIDCAYSSVEGFKSGVAKLAKLVKPGGKLCLHQIEGTGTSFFYTVGSKTFYGLSIAQETLASILTQLGFKDIQYSRQVRDGDIPLEACDFTAIHFTMGTKN